mgnify:FL=1
MLALLPCVMLGCDAKTNTPSQSFKLMWRFFCLVCVSKLVKDLPGVEIRYPDGRSVKGSGMDMIRAGKTAPFGPECRADTTIGAYERVNAIVASGLHLCISADIGSSMSNVMGVRQQVIPTPEGNLYKATAPLKHGKFTDQCAVCGLTAHQAKVERGEALEETRLRSLMACSVCKKICYCSAECQKKDWKSHKKVCKTL